MQDKGYKDYKDWLVAKALANVYRAYKRPLPVRYARLLKQYGTGLDPK